MHATPPILPAPVKPPRPITESPDHRTPTPVALAGGGTGGHLFPNLAVVERLIERGVPVDAHLLISDRKLDGQLIERAASAMRAGTLDGLEGDSDHAPAASLRPHPLPCRPPGARPRAALRFALGHHASRRRCDALFRQHRPAALIATGGFVSPAPVLAARALGIPTALVNLDAVPGRANRFLARRVHTVFSTAATDDLPGARPLGFPLRFAAVSHLDPASARAGLGLKSDVPTLLVFAGSQGARTVNHAMIELARRSGTGRMLAGWQVLHLTGAGDTDDVRDAYDAAGIHAVVQPFCHRMGLAWASADLAIARAGAGSIAEAHANHVPALLLPYPFHRDQHQRLNALPLVNAGGAQLLTDHIDPAKNVAEILGPLRHLLANRNQRDAMRQVLMQRPLEDGANTLCDWLLNHIGD